MSFKYLLLFQLILLCVAHNQGKSVKLSKKQAHHKHHKSQKFLDSIMDVNDDSIELLLQKHENFYLAEMTVGTPEQKLTVLIDTGSPNLLLTSSLCQQNSCIQHGSYNPSLSTTSYYIEAIKLANGEVGNEIDIQFASGSVVGVFFEDRVCLNQYCVNNQFIVGIVEQSEDIFSQMKFDGILGLGRIKEAVVKNASYIHNLEYDTDTRNFSLYLSNSDDDDMSSELVLGGISLHLIAPGEEFKFFEVTSDNLWTVNIKAVFLGDERIDDCNNCQGLIDSGTSFISFPVYAMEKFYQKFGVYQLCSNIDTFPDLTFVLDRGIKFTLAGSQYFKRNTHALFSKDICIPYIKNNPIIGDELIVLGQPFLIHHYVWFDEDQSKIGIVKSKQQSHQS
ncbi:unnamed protein product [Paramecium octaurelia]|uniref:Peptidase A1 domain-containing protein n=1 Tax=Paramecium octaurelia TaxID=43137 RepID=A0A8S1WMG1_PAROT|nr:unnamed protein product [Paramecium octaurelia]